MLRLGVLLSLMTALLLCLSPTVTSVAQEQKEKGKAAGKVESKAVADKEAAIPDFVEAFDLPFESLHTLGVRLSEARRKYDPIALALVSTEVSLAEKASGKTAAVTAGSLLAEAVALAELRDDAKELKAIASLQKDKTVADRLTALAKEAEEAEAKRIKDEMAGTERGFLYLEVINRSPCPTTIHVDGRPVGFVPPWGRIVFGPFFEHRHNRSVRLEARGCVRWKTEFSPAEYRERFTWILLP
jgi:hypothetical protein